MTMEWVGLSEAGVPGPLFFAREPDTDFVLEELDAPDRTRPPHKPPRSNTIVLLILLLIVAVGAYFAMNPESVMRLLGQETVSARPPGQAPGGARTTAPSDTQRSGPDPVATQPPSVPDMVPSPLFGEGQHAMVNGASASPGSPTALSVDSTGAERGRSVRPGEVVTVIDAEWLGNTWVYWVRTQDGARGWISEKQLTAPL
jgi:hypothetical protein